MTSIQSLLILLFLLGLLVFAKRRKGNLVYRVVIALLGFIGPMLVLFPSYSTQVAQMLGVGRGADLIFYIFIVTMMFVSIAIYGRVRNVSLILTKVVRSLAQKEAINNNEVRNNLIEPKVES